MGIFPKPPKATPAANTPIKAMSPDQIDQGLANPLGSLITTSTQGLKRKANTQRTALIGG